MENNRKEHTEDALKPTLSERICLAIFVLGFFMLIIISGIFLALGEPPPLSFPNLIIMSGILYIILREDKK